MAAASPAVELLPFSPADVSDAYVGWLNDPEVMRFTEARHASHTRESAAAYVAACEASDTVRLWRIAADGAHVGNLRLSGIDRHNRRASIALIIGDRRQWGRGIGPAAINRAADIGFGELDLNKLSAGIYANNPASVRAFEKAGFRAEARLADHYMFEGGFIDVILMARFRTDAA